MSEQRLIDANALLEVLEQRKRLCTGVYGDLGGAISGVIKLIDNAPTVEITEKQAINKLYETGWLSEMAEAYDDLLKKMGESEPVIEKDTYQIRKAYERGFETGLYAKRKEALEERPQGEWVCIVKGNLGINMYACSLCGHRITCTEGAMKQHKGCYCGAQMKGDAK